MRPIRARLAILAIAGLLWSQGFLAAFPTHLQRLGRPAAVCVAIHALFVEDAYDQLINPSAARIVSTDSIPHPSSAISIAALLADNSAGWFGRTPVREV